MGGARLLPTSLLSSGDRSLGRLGGHHLSQAFFLSSLIHSALAGGAPNKTLSGVGVEEAGLCYSPIASSPRWRLEAAWEHLVEGGGVPGSTTEFKHSLGSNSLNRAPEIRHQAAPVWPCGLALLIKTRHFLLQGMTLSIHKQQG